MRWLGWAAGFGLAIALSVAVPMGFLFGLLTGFGLSLFGYLLGAAAERRP